MKKIADLEINAGISLPQDCLNFIGPPNLLIGQVIFVNNTNDHLFISQLKLEHERIKQIKDLQFDAFQVNAELKPGQKLIKRVKIALDKHLPPASYDMDVSIGGIKKRIKLIIQPSVNIEINPSEVNLFGIAPGLSHHAEIQISNLGNIPLNLPVGDEEAELSDKNILECLVHSLKQNGREEAMNTLDSFFKNLRQELENNVKISFEKINHTLKPGETVTSHIILTLPHSLKMKSQYDGKINIYNDHLVYRIIEKAKAKPSGKVSKRQQLTKRNKEV